MSKIDVVLNESREAFVTENDRSERLTGTAEKYLAAVAILASIEVLDLKGPFHLLTNLTRSIPGWLSVAALLALGLSFAVTLLTMRTRQYMSHPRGMALIDNIKSEEIDDNAAKVMIAKMYLMARDKNATINDERARLLTFSGVALAVGFVLAIASKLLHGFVR